MFIRRILSIFVLLSFLFTSLGPLPQARADEPLSLPVPGTMINLTPAFEPALIKGLTVDRDNPFRFNFIMDAGESGLSGEALKKEGDRLVKYFFACLTIPEKDLWVNLSPYEKERIIPQPLGETLLGRDLLAQDYILKQLTASLIYPEKDLGKEFWSRVYAKARELYGTTQVPVNTFNKVWILADKATVYERGQTAFVLDGHLKVMLEEDYLALEKHSVVIASDAQSHSIASNIVRSIILPEIEKEVNTGKNFAALRQIFNSLILASWYKKNLKEALLNQAYADKNTVKGVNLDDPTVKTKIYRQYLQAYKKGVFNYIKEDADPETKEVLPRKYFSGGFGVNAAMLTVKRGPGLLKQVVSKLGASSALFSLAVSLSLNQLPALAAAPSAPNVTVTAPVASLSDAAMLHTENLVGETRLLGISSKTLAKRIKLVLDGNGDQTIPFIATISDEHGTIYKLDALLVHILRSVPAGRRIPIDFVLKPDQTLAEQLKPLGIKLKDFKGQLFIHNLGDFMDRGPYGVRVFMRSKELIDAQLSDFIIGNHDLWMFMNLIGFHLPTYDNFNFHGYKDEYDSRYGEVQNVLKEKHRVDLKTRKATWWAEKLAEFRKFQDEQQEKVWDLKEPGVNWLIGQLTNGMTKDEKRDWYDTKEGKVWAKLQGYNPDVGEVQTGVRAVGLVSIKWWEDLLAEFIAIRNAGEAGRSIQPGSSQERIWDTAVDLIGKEIIPALKKDLERELNGEQLTGAKEKKWYWRIFEAINYKNYNSPEWWAQDWVFHEGWGTAVLKEINSMYGGKETVTSANYLDDPLLNRIAKFYERKFNLHIRDIMQTDYMHAFLPIDPATGEFYFNYKGAEYRGNGSNGVPSYRQGLAIISRDVQKAFVNGKFNPESYEALSLVNSWYADVTTAAKPSHVADALTRIGVKKVAKANGINRLMTGHLPTHDFLKLTEDRRRIITGFNVSTEDQQHFIFTDHGAGERFGGGAKYVEQSQRGLHLVGYPHKNSEAIVSDPPTVIFDKANQPVTVYKENEPISGYGFLINVWNNIEVNNKAMMGGLTTADLDFIAGEIHQAAVLVNGPNAPAVQNALGVMEKNLRGAQDWDSLSKVIPLSVKTMARKSQRDDFESIFISQGPLRKAVRDGIAPARTQAIAKAALAWVSETYHSQSVSSERIDGLKTLHAIAQGTNGQTDFIEVLIALRHFGDLAMAADKAAITPLNFIRGGIDLNTSAMTTTIRKEGGGVEMRFDPAMVARIRKDGIQSLVPVIYKITPVSNVWSALGMQAPHVQEQLAAV